MRSGHMLKAIDDKGRFTLPFRFRKRLRLKPGDLLEIYIRKDGLVLRKYKENYDDDDDFDEDEDE